MNKKGMGYISMVIVLLVLTIGFAVSTNPEMDIGKFKNSFNWTHIDIDVPSSPDLENAVTSMANGLGEATFSIGKWAAQWAYENPGVPWKLLVWGLLLSIAAPIILVLFKLGVIIIILIKELIQSRREKKMYRRKV